MLYNLKVSALQERLFRSGKSAVFFLKHEPFHTEITLGDYVSINQHESEAPNLMVEVFDSFLFSSREELLKDYLFTVKVRDEVKEAITGEIDVIFHESKEITVIFGFTFYDSQEKESNIALNGITKILFYSSLYFRNLPYKKRLFKRVIDEPKKELFYKQIHIVNSAIGVLLKSEAEMSDFINTLTSSIQNETIESFPYLNNIKSLIEVFKLYPEIRYINAFRLKRINEFTFRTEEVLKAFEMRDYETVRQIGYDIHNVPEFIRTMNDWRDEN